MPDLVVELRSFKRDLDEYVEILGRIWQRAPGEGWYAAATDQEDARVDELRASLAERYGGLQAAIVQALGHEPIVEQYGIVGGDVFHLAFADPADNPWLSAVLDMAPTAVLQAIGYHQMRKRGRGGRAFAVFYRELKEWVRMITDLLGKLPRWPF